MTCLVKLFVSVSAWTEQWKGQPHIVRGNDDCHYLYSQRTLPRNVTYTCLEYYQWRHVAIPGYFASLFYSYTISWSFKIYVFIIQNFLKLCYPSHVEGQELDFRHCWNQKFWKNYQSFENSLLHEDTHKHRGMPTSTCLPFAQWEHSSSPHLSQNSYATCCFPCFEDTLPNVSVAFTFSDSLHFVSKHGLYSRRGTPDKLSLVLLS